MQDFTQLLTVALSIVSVATLAGLGLLRGTVTNLREQLKDERDRSASLLVQRTEDRTKIDQLSTDLAALGRVVTGEAHWIAVGQQLDKHHTDVAEHWADARRHWAAELDALQELTHLLRSTNYNRGTDADS